MKTKINIAEILRNKPRGIRLYSPIFGNCTFCYIREDTNDICVKKYYDVIEYFNSEGLYFTLGEVMLFPSKEMRDWTKFSWKKGDLLINSCGFQCIFKEWASDDYTKFKGCYSNSRDGYEDVSNAETAKFDKLDNNIAYGYVREIERKLGGKLNRETLEIEKIQPEFKDGDIIVTAGASYLYYSKCIIILKGDLYTKDNKAHSYAFYNINNKFIDFDIIDTRIRDREIRLATDSEKQQLFSTLEKEGKAWDAKKKQIVDLKPKVELKPFDKVVVRCSKADKWSIDFFSYKVSNGYICTGDAWFGYCLPYNEETSKLVGTTNNMED